jgi:hypothetical protein
VLHINDFTTSYQYTSINEACRIRASPGRVCHEVLISTGRAQRYMRRDTIIAVIEHVQMNISTK